MSERKPLVLMTQEQAEAFARLVEAAERGDGAAACRLGDMYREGQGGLRYSPRQTYHWYARSAMAGDANGQNNLGACYEHGLECAQSYTKAVKWYRLAVAQRLSTASMNLGYCHLRGHGVPRDEVEALRLFREAVEGGEERAAQEVERLESQDSPRVSKPVPAGTQRVLPWRLGSRVPPRDGPPEQLRHPEPGLAETVTSAADLITLEADEPEATASADGSVRFVDETEPGRHFGLTGGVTSSPSPWEDEDVWSEPVKVLSAETVSAAEGADGPTEDELFPIFAEGGLKPDDLVEGVAERYAEYLKARGMSS
jgi:hypothetical protein